jgi:hypothetical protein
MTYAGRLWVKEDLFMAHALKTEHEDEPEHEHD